MSTQNKSYLTWTARGLAIIYILFLSLFALDVISPEYSQWEILVGLFMHLIPTWFLIAALVIAWRSPLIGGGLFLILGVIGTVYFGNYRSPLEFMMISLPCFVIGLLFIMANDFNRRAEANRAT